MCIFITNRRKRSNARKKQAKIGIAYIRIYSRPSFAIWSLDGGVPVGDLQDRLGHATLAITGIYLKASPNYRREAYMRSKLPSFLAGDAVLNNSSKLLR